jgi:Ca-activated chloride channel family protein
MNRKAITINLALTFLTAGLLAGCGLFGLGSPADEVTDWQAGINENNYSFPAESAEEEGSINQDDRDRQPSSPEDTYSGEAEIGEPALESNKSKPGFIENPELPYPPIPVEPPDMYFEDYGVNPFIETEDDNYSTFAADVDTGSYTLARSYLNQGMRPPEEAVRVEEFVNFFPQGYELPSARETFRIHVDGAPTPFTESERYRVIRIGIQGYDVPERDRKDAALTFVIDVSGSMGNGNRLRMVQDSLELLLDQLGPSDTVGIVAYTDTAWVVLEPTSARHKAEIAEAIYSLYPMASTNAEAGLVLGYREATKAYLPNGINRVVLCSDGVANVGNTGSDSIWESIADYASEGITLTSVGVGMGNYNDILMEQLADQGNGFYAYVDSMEEANRLFVTDLVSTLQVIAYDAKIQVVFNPEVVTRYRLIGFENRDIADEDFRDNSVDAAEIGAGHAVTALYEIKLAPGARGEIATIQLRWQNPDTFRVEEISETFDTRDLEDSFHQADAYFQMDVLVAEFAEILRDSYWASDTSLREIMEYTQEIADRVERQEFYEFLELLERALYL